MPRAKNKEELVESSEKNFKRLNDFINQLDNSMLSKEFPKTYLNRNVRDVIAHLHHWNLMFIGWYDAGMSGEKPDMPAKGYTWKTLPELNKKIQVKYKDMPLKEARALFESSFTDIRKLIKKHSEDELFEKKTLQMDWHNFACCIFNIC